VSGDASEKYFKGLQIYFYIIAILPLWFRFAQCLRKYYDSRMTPHVINAGKYGTAIAA